MGPTAGDLGHLRFTADVERIRYQRDCFIWRQGRFLKKVEKVLESCTVSDVDRAGKMSSSALFKNKLFEILLCSAGNYV